MSASPRTGVVEELVKELYRMSRIRRELASHALAELGSHGFMALAVIDIYGPLRVSDVADRLLIDLSVASRQVAALTRAGYVEREPDPDDGRAFLVSSTAEGKRAVTVSHDRMTRDIACALNDWPDADIAVLAGGLARLREDFATTVSTSPLERVA